MPILLGLRWLTHCPRLANSFRTKSWPASLDQTEPNTFATASILLRMVYKMYMFTKDRTAFVGLGWSNIATSLSPQTIDEKKTYQPNCSCITASLPCSPNVDRQLHTPEVSGSRTLIFGGGSHASQLATVVGSIYPEAVDLTIGSLKLSEKTAEDLANDIVNPNYPGCCA